MKTVEFYSVTDTGKRYLKDIVLLATPYEISKSDWLNNHYDKELDIYNTVREVSVNMQDDDTVYAVILTRDTEILEASQLTEMLYKAVAVITNDIVE